MVNEEYDYFNGSTKDILSRFARVDERTRVIQEEIRNMRLDVKNDINLLITRIKDNEESFEDQFVKKETFKPVQALVYGFVGIVLTSVIGALISLVIIIKSGT